MSTVEQLQQRSPIWWELRAGMVTASRFKDVLVEPQSHPYEVKSTHGEWSVFKHGEITTSGYRTKKSATEDVQGFAATWREKNWSESAKTYLWDLMHEKISGRIRVTKESFSQRWGREGEPLAQDAIAEHLRKHFGEEIRLPEGDLCFCQHHSEPGIGFSPDFAVGDDAGGEIKNPERGGKHLRLFGEPETSIDTFLKEHRAQVFGGAWCRKWKDYYIVSYDRDLESVGMALWIKKIEVDYWWVNKVLAPKVLRFRDLLFEKYDQMVGEPF